MSPAKWPEFAAELAAALVAVGEPDLAAQVDDRIVFVEVS